MERGEAAARGCWLVQLWLLRWLLSRAGGRVPTKGRGRGRVCIGPCAACTVPPWRAACGGGGGSTPKCMDAAHTTVSGGRGARLRSPLGALACSGVPCSWVRSSWVRHHTLPAASLCLPCSRHWGEGGRVSLVTAIQGAGHVVAWNPATRLPVRSTHPLWGRRCVGHQVHCWFPRPRCQAAQRAAARGALGRLHMPGLGLGSSLQGGGSKNGRRGSGQRVGGAAVGHQLEIPHSFLGNAPRRQCLRPCCGSVPQWRLRLTAGQHYPFHHPTPIHFGQATLARDCWAGGAQARAHNLLGTACPTWALHTDSGRRPPHTR